MVFSGDVTRSLRAPRGYTSLSVPGDLGILLFSVRKTGKNFLSDLGKFLRNSVKARIISGALINLPGVW